MTPTPQTLRNPKRKLLTATAALAAALLAALVSACSLNPAPKGYDLHASFSRAIGLYPNSKVRVQGINVGVVTKIRPRGTRVDVTLRIASGHKIPKDATAALVPASLIGERYIQLAPVYTGGAALQPGGQIRHTSIPAEFDELLRSLQNFAGSIDPKNASDFLTNLSSLLAGQGKALNDLIASGSGTLQLLADKSGDLGNIIDSLSTLTTALQGHTAEIQKLITDYNTLAGVLADNTGNIDRTITSLDSLAAEVTDLLQSHAPQLPFDVEQLTHATRTVDRNFDSLQVLLASTVRLFDAAGRAYDPAHNALALNNQLSAGYTSQILAYRLRDRLSGLCLRLHIASCADPATSPFNSVVNLLPSLIGKLPAVNGGPVQGQAPQATAPPPQPAARSATSAPVASSLDSIALTAEQRRAIDNLTQNILPVLRSLKADELQALLTLTPQQITALGKLAPTQIPAALDQIRAGSLTPDALLKPLLPQLAGGTNNPALNNLTDAVLNALGALGGK